MFALFTGSEFGRGFAQAGSQKSNLSSYLDAYRRNRAKLNRQVPVSTTPLVRAA
jgi:hypothetical protein